MHYKNLTLAFALTGILLISIFAVYTYQQQKINALLNSQQLSQSKTGLPTTPKSAPTTVTGTTSDWKTYKNSQYGFEFKYPSDWAVGDFDGQITISPPNHSGDFGSALVIQSSKNNLLISQLCGSKKNNDFNTIEGIYCGPQYSGQSTKNINGTNWEILPHDYASFPPAGSITYDTVYKNRLYSIHNLSLTLDEEKGLDQILSTFKFTTPTSNSTTNWQTYSDPAIGLTFQYPADFKIQHGSGFLLFPNEDYKISIKAPITSDSLEDWITKQNFCSNFGNQFSTCLEERNNWPLPNSYLLTSNNHNHTSIDFVIRSGNRIFDITMETVNSNTSITDSAKSTFNQILSTFKFTN